MAQSLAAYLPLRGDGGKWDIPGSDSQLGAPTGSCVGSDVKKTVFRYRKELQGGGAGGDFSGEKGEEATQGFGTWRKENLGSEGKEAKLEDVAKQGPRVLLRS